MAATSASFVLFLIAAAFFLSSATSLQIDCTGRQIYIRRLPPRFNTDLLANCSAYPLFVESFCPYTANHGLGLKTHNRSQSWYRTDPLLLELLFHRRVLEYPCLSTDPSAADAVFLPYYSALDALKYLYGPEVNSSFNHGLDLHRFLLSDQPHIWSRRSGHDHFLVMARPAWDFSQPLSNDPPIWGTSFLELPDFLNVTALTFESRPWPWQEQAIPYPTSFHPPNLPLLNAWIRRVSSSRRTVLSLFAGGGGGISASPNIRRSIRIECENTSSFDPHPYSKLCEVVDCSNGVCEHDPIRYIKPMLQSAFCFQPPGDTLTRRSTFDSILAGCIPVFFEDQSARSQYTWHLLEEEFGELSVFIPKENVVYGDLKIIDVLMAIPSWKVRRMREKVVEVMPRIIYRSHGSSPGLRAKKDAFDITIERTLERIKTRLEEVSAQ
ncbi:hypothetical protein SAY87_011526 [Trapa incisa]|uniref:Exostosin GT47 domain-containing protein n=1 Tax=Trapa incisa TaxID=236973 RepID=A0AAN7GWF7_9MYRT|nr:hypothetical protein SAY87_011526 [Trapa incisa]